MRTSENQNRPPILAKICLGTHLVLIATAPTWAQEEPIDAAASLRRNMTSVVDRLEEITGESPATNIWLPALEDARGILDQMSDADYAFLAPAIDSDVTSLLGALEAMRGYSVPPPTPVSASSGFPDADYLNEPWGFSFSGRTQRGDTPNDGDGTNQSEGAWCNVTNQPNPEQSFLNLNLRIFSQGLADSARRVCDQEGAGINFALACLPVDILYMVVVGLEEFPSLCGDNMTAAEITGNYRRIGHIHSDVETVETNLASEISDNQSLLTDLRGELDEHDVALRRSTDAVADSLDSGRDLIDDFRSLMALLDIELHLSKTDTGAISSFQRSASDDGYMELVVEVVEEAIANTLAAGESTGRASRHLSKAQTLLARGDRRRGFDYLGRAYREVAR